MVRSPLRQNASTPVENRPRQWRQFKGIRMRKWGKWVSEVRMPNSRERIWLGTYDTPQQAARAYDAAVYCLRGRKAEFNFPDTPPEIPSASSLSPEQIKAAAARIALGPSSVSAGGAPSTPRSSPSPSESDFSATDSQQIPDEDEDLAFWKSLFTQSHAKYCSTSDIFPSLNQSNSPSEAPGGIFFEQDDLWNLI